MANHIQDPELYRLVRAAVAELLRGGFGPTVSIMMLGGLQRSVPKVRVMSGGKFDPSRVPGNLAAYDADLDFGRFTGIDDKGQPFPVGGLYIAAGSTSSIGAEVVHYQSKDAQKKGATVKRITFADAMADRAVVVLEPASACTVLDLADINGRQFLEQVVKRPTLRDRWPAAAKANRWASPFDAMLDSSSNFTVSRAIGHAAADAAFAGLRLPSARQSDRSGEGAENVVLFGRPRKPVPYVKATRVFIFEHARSAATPEWQAHPV